MTGFLGLSVFPARSAKKTKWLQNEVPFGTIKLFHQKIYIHVEINACSPGNENCAFKRVCSDGDGKPLHTILSLGNLKHAP